MNPFKENSNQHHDYEVLKDLNWHCAKCELHSGQAKTWQTWRDAHGIQFEEPTPRRWESRIYCKTCGKKTVHRKLKTLEVSEITSARSGVSQKTANRIKQLLNSVEAVLLRQLPDRLLQPDHKFPQIRWNKNEIDNDGLSDEELIEKFILLNENNNQLKSRNCERCVQTNKRGNFPGIYFWYEGDENWTAEPHDEKGCVGCFWYDPYKWREELNKIVADS